MKGRDAVTADKSSVYARRFRVLAAAFLLLFFGSFLLGRFAVAPGTLFRILWDALREWVCKLFGAEVPGELYSGQEKAVVLNIRLPRVALSALVGAGLSVAGTAYQGMFRNPMVSPDILGASNGAGFGAALGILLSFNYFGVTVSAFVCGVGAVALTLALYRYRNRGPWLSFLSGMLVGSAVEYGCSFLQELILGSRSWDYSHLPFNLGGRINLLYCFFWGFAAIAWFKVLFPPISACIEKLPPRGGRVLTWALCIFMAADIAVSSAALVRYNDRLNGVPASNSVEVYLDEHYGNDRMYQVYPKAVHTNS